MKALVLGITGIMSSGKSSFCKALSLQGVEIISSDELVDKLYQKDSDGAKELAKLRIPGIIKIDGSVDKPKLRDLMFSNTDVRRKVEQAIHPIIISEIKELIKTKKSEIVAVEIPLLFEAKLESLCDVTLTVFRKKHDAISSIMKKYDISVNKAEEMLRAQLPITSKMILSDLTVINNGPVDDMDKKAKIIKRSVLELWKN